MSAAKVNGAPDFGPLVEAQAHVLEHVLELEQRRVVVLAHRPGLQLEHRRVARAGAPSPPCSASRSTPGLGADDERLAERRGVHRGHRVVDELHHLAVAERAAVDDRLAHRLEQRPGARQVLGAPPTMIVSVPSSARGEEPVTGASTIRTLVLGEPPRDLARPLGPIVDMSTHSVPGRAAAATPSRRAAPPRPGGRRRPS